MNAKLNFIEFNRSVNLEAVREILKRDLKDFSEIVDSYEKYLNIKSDFSCKWNTVLNNPVYEYVEEDNQFKIKSKN